MRTGFLAAALAAGLAAPASATTIDFSIVFNLTGEAAPVGSGTFSVPDNAFAAPVTTWSFSFSFPINGSPVTYTFPGTGSSGVPFYRLAPPSLTPALSGIDLVGDGQGDPRLTLSWGSEGQTTVGFWSINTSAVFTCPPPEEGSIGLAFGQVRFCSRSWGGSYTITGVGTDAETPVIPLPATAALLPLGLVALGAFRRRKTG
jgi:hypothetical protein